MAGFLLPSPEAVLAITDGAVVEVNPRDAGIHGTEHVVHSPESRAKSG